MWCLAFGYEVFRVTASVLIGTGTERQCFRFQPILAGAVGLQAEQDRAQNTCITSCEASRLGRKRDEGQLARNSGDEHQSDLVL